MIHHTLYLALLLPVLSSQLLYHVLAQDCSATKLCATGCCSKFGFCGTDKEHCGDGCLSTCDFKLGCDADNPCKDGTCCSKFGFCGMGPDYCSPETCVAGCKAKSQCDPGGYGAAYVNYTTCPLNVCCSKFGYCGITEEFCGDKKVDRPSCETSNPIARVVGYYEGWAARRTCQAFMPEDVPLGVYTHLNFAFASVDPATFKVVPAEAGDVDLYSRLTALKKKDSQLKVYIAIGGWAFNDPGPTASTFSDLAGSEANQAKFFASLISFMATYNFDGVDIDWEYPAADDRSGREADFANFPAFIKNLKRALASSSGGRDGVSITLPVSYWYLQHFDVVALEPWVDWFNVMSYDLHGLWDKGNKWLGPFLNSHTNLTEITDYMDLLWRNMISPNKVTLGLAFYSRTFIASDAGCMEPGCTFDAVGDEGPCTQSAGTWSNAELTDKIKAAGVKSELHDEGAVKIAKIGKNWITYDDADSWKLKLDFARGECMGGVMVWAVSQDYTDGTYSKQLQSVTQYTSPAIVRHGTDDGDTVDEPDAKVTRNQCLWANCGQSCPSGYTAVPRKDGDAKKGEVMQDGTRCRGGAVRVFCCPSAQTIPNCGWFDFNNGKCGKNHNSVCPAGSEKIIGPHSSEVASVSFACNTKHGFEVACCETDPDGFDITADLGYSTCQWDGVPDGCGDYVADPVSSICDRDGDFSFFLDDSLSGSGAVTCWGDGRQQNRAYCCKPQGPFPDTQWQRCQWVFPRKTDDGWCEAYCPDNTVRIAMQDPPVYLGCKGGLGGQALCCQPRFLTEATSDSEKKDAYISALKEIATNTCSWSAPTSLSLRGIDAAPSRTTTAATTTATPGPSFPGRGDDSSRGELAKRAGSEYACSVAFSYTFNMRGTNDAGLRATLEDGWNQAIVQQLGYRNLPASRIENQPSGIAFSDLDPPLQTYLVEAQLNTIPDNNNNDETEEAPVCPFFWYTDPGLVEDEDDGGEDDGEAYFRHKVKKRSIHDALERAWETGDFKTNWAFEKGEEEEAASQEGNTTTTKPGLERRKAFAEFLTAKAEEIHRRTTNDYKKVVELNNGEKFGLDKDEHESKEEEGIAFNSTVFFPFRGHHDDGPVPFGPQPEHSRGGAKEVAELIRRLLEERDQTGAERRFRVRSARNNQWPRKYVWSSEYPNGNQGDDIIYLNTDSHRYKVVSRGCGPQDYTLKTDAAKSEATMWVSEHILELQTIGRFLTAILDGQLAPVPSVGMDSAFMYQASQSVVNLFIDGFTAWTNRGVSMVAPGDTALMFCGSVAFTSGMVVADSNLNAIKGRIYRFARPASNAVWITCCSQATQNHARQAFSIIQTTMAVFDYYGDSNVKNRHGWAYGQVKLVMQEFEDAYRVQTGVNIYGSMQIAWRYYMQEHMKRVVKFSQIWVGEQLRDLSNVWWAEYQSAMATGAALRAMYAVEIIELIDKYLSDINSGSRMQFDTSIFY